MASWAGDVGDDGLTSPEPFAGTFPRFPVRAGRLFRKNGKPTLTAGQRFLLRECGRELRLVDEARGELARALEQDDVELCVAASRRLLAIGLVLGDRVRHVGSSA